MLLQISIPTPTSAHGERRLTALMLKSVLEGLVEANVYLMRVFPHQFPPLYESHIRFQAESDLRQDYIPAADALVSAGYGDCAPLAAYRAAELRIRGEPATIKIYWREPRDGTLEYHAQVRRADGSVEDPSRMLGMSSAT